MTQNSNWEKANKHCKDIHPTASLVVVESENIERFLVNQIEFMHPVSDVEYWIGAKMTGGKFTWLDPDQFFIPQKLKNYLDKQTIEVSLISFSDISYNQITL